MFKTLNATAATLTLGLLCLSPAPAAVFTATGTSADIQTAVDNFRAALGANNGVGGTFSSGRREINWDAVPLGFSSPTNLPGNFFNVNSPRGLVMTPVGGATGLQVSANAADPAGAEFANLNAAYPGQFTTFSSQKLFTVIGGNQLQVDFFVPGTNIAATVAGFGVVFTDVQRAAGTIFQVFLGDGSNGGQFAIPTNAAAGSLSFLGLTDPNRYSRIIITSGSADLGSGVSQNLTNLIDVVAMDDFIFGEPTAPVPEPSTLILSGAGLLALALRWRRH